MALHNHNAKGDGNEARNVLAGMRAAQALQLRKLGFTYDLIAQQCNYKDRGAAHHAVMRELKRTIQEPAEDLRALEVERLDALMTTFMPRALKGDNGAADRVLRIMERRATLLGLDAPANVNLTADPNKLGVTLVLEQMRHDPRITEAASRFLGVAATTAEAG